MGTKDANQATADLEKKVQPYANVIGLARSIPESIISCIACLFLGSWSDRHGRKLVLLFCIGGRHISLK